LTKFFFFVTWRCANIMLCICGSFVLALIHMTRWYKQDGCSSHFGILYSGSQFLNFTENYALIIWFTSDLVKKINLLLVTVQHRLISWAIVWFVMYLAPIPVSYTYIIYIYRCCRIDDYLNCIIFKRSVVAHTAAIYRYRF